MKTKLTIEQSNRLIELGVSRDIASETEIYDEPWHRAYYAVFTVTDLLAILPKALRKEGLAYHYELTIKWDEDCHTWRALYDAIGDNIGGTCAAPELIDALYSLAVWLIGNNLLQQ